MSAKSNGDTKGSDMAKKKSAKKTPKQQSTARPKKNTAEQPANPTPTEASRRRESPKRTGRRGPRPLDPKDDFQTPVKDEAAQGEPIFPETAPAARKPRQPRLPQMEDPQ